MSAASIVDAAIRRLFEKARGWNRIAKAARGDDRWRAYEQKKRAIERIRELRPAAVRVDSVEVDASGSITIGVTIRAVTIRSEEPDIGGRLHLRLGMEEHSSRGCWHDLAWTCANRT